MRTDAQRIAKYEARMAAALIDPVRSAVNTAQKANFAAYATNWVPIHEALNAFLSGAAVPIIQFAAYTAFAGEIYHLTKHFSGPTLTAGVATCIAKWSDDAHLGSAASTILTAITTEVFHVDTVPITP